MQVSGFPSAVKVTAFAHSSASPYLAAVTFVYIYVPGGRSAAPPGPGL